MNKAVMPVLQVKIESLSDPNCKDFKTLLEASHEFDVISLSGNSYGLPFFEELAPLLKKITSVKKLLLSDIFISRKDSIVPSLKILSECFSHKNVAYLDLSSNALCPDGTAAVDQLIVTNPISHLLFDHVALSREGSVSLCQSIEKGKLNLKVLKVCKNRIEDKGINFAKVIENQPSLEEIVIFQNNIKGAEMEALALSLSKCKELRRVDLSDNVIEGKAILALCEVVKNCPHLHYLNIGDCNIGFEDSEIFFKALVEHAPKSLCHLIFNYNDFADLEAVSDAIKLCSGIKHFEFKHFEHDKKKLKKAVEDLKHVNFLYESDEEDEEVEDGEVDKEQEKMDKLLDELNDLKI